MNVLALLAGGLLGALAGYGIGLALGLALLRGSEREGRRATLAAFAVAPAAAIPGALLGAILGARLAPDAAALGLVPLVAGALAGALYLRHRARRPLGLNRAAPRLAFEIEGTALPRAVTLVTDRNTMPATLEAVRPDLCRGSVELYHRTRRRGLRFDPGPTFALPLAAAPRAQEWSDWRTLDTGLRLRWRVSTG